MQRVGRVFGVGFPFWEKMTENRGRRAESREQFYRWWAGRWWSHSFRKVLGMDGAPEFVVVRVGWGVSGPPAEVG